MAFFNQQTGRNLTPIFDQYLRRSALPTLELRFQEGGGVSYRWKTDVKDFAMPVKVGRSANWQANAQLPPVRHDPRSAGWQTITPTTEWQTMKTELKREEFEAATDLYYIDVVKY